MYTTTSLIGAYLLTLAQLYNMIVNRHMSLRMIT
jgi:hypothetical protein